MYGISSKEICNLISILKNGHHFQFLTSPLNLWVLSTYYVSEIIYKDSSYSSWSRKTMAKSQYNYLGDLSYCVYAFILSRIKLQVFIFFSHKSVVGFKKKTKFIISSFHLSVHSWPDTRDCVSHLSFTDTIQRDMFQLLVLALDLIAV